AVGQSLADATAYVGGDGGVEIEVGADVDERLLFAEQGEDLPNSRAGERLRLPRRRLRRRHPARLIGLGDLALELPLPLTQGRDVAGEADGSGVGDDRPSFGQ